MHRKDHWERVYTTKGERDVSWFESLPASHTMFPLFSIVYRPGRFRCRTQPRLIDRKRLAFLRVRVDDRCFSSSREHYS